MQRNNMTEITYFVDNYASGFRDTEKCVAALYKTEGQTLPSHSMEDLVLSKQPITDEMLDQSSERAFDVPCDSKRQFLCTWTYKQSKYNVVKENLDRYRPYFNKDEDGKVWSKQVIT